MRITKDQRIKLLYEDNKKVLMEAGYTEEIFTNNMKTIMKENNVYTKGAWKIFKHKREFVDQETVGAENLIQGIKNMDKQTYHDLRKEVIGWKEKVNYENFSYVNDKYQYTNSKGDTYVFTLITGDYGSQYWTWMKK